MIRQIITTRMQFSTGKGKSLPGTKSILALINVFYTQIAYLICIIIFYYFRYRKFNLFIELGFNHTNLSELCTFDTDFGVRFGMFICFDILFKDPAIRLIQESGVKDIIFSAAWFSELPLLTGEIHVYCTYFFFF